MSLPLTPEALEAAYNYLRTCAPFKGWKLPEAEEVEFHVTRHKDQEGDWEFKNGRHSVRISQHTIGHTDSLMQAMAHEMVHMFQYITKSETPNAVHNWRFNKLAGVVCRVHGWDAKKFAL